MKIAVSFTLATLLCWGAVSPALCLGDPASSHEVAQQGVMAPRALSVNAAPGDLGQHELRLHWEAVAGATGYEVLEWRKGKWWLNEDDPNRTPLTTSTSLSGLEVNTAYEFCVRAVGEGGKTSANSATAGGRTLSPGAEAPLTPKETTVTLSVRPNGKGIVPEPPSGIIGLYSEADRIKLSWRPVVGAVRYSVEQEKDGKWAPAEKVVGDVSAASVFLIDRPGPRAYKFRVRAVNREGTLSEPSWEIVVRN